MVAPERGGLSPDKPLILILIKRAAIFLFVLCAISVFYWIVGSESSFLDSTQAMLLGIMRLSSMGVIVACGMGLLLSIALALVRRHRLKVLGLAGYVAAAAIAAAALVIAQSVTILSRGIH